MANQERIDEFISEAGFSQIDKLVKALTGANEHIVQCILSAEKLNTALAKSGAFKDLEVTMKKIEIANEQLRKVTAEAILMEDKIAATRKKSAADFERDVQKNIALQEKQAARSKKTEQSERLAQIKLDQDRKKSFDSYSSRINKQNEIDEKRSKLIERNSRPYAVLSNELEKQRKKAQDLAIIYGENSKQFLESAKSVGILDARLKAIDTVLGKNTRNVGNYASGFSNFSGAINQLTRELPALAVNAQTFFLAISNNLPALFDAIETANKAKKESKEAAREEAQAQYDSVKSTELAAGATEDAASATADFAKEQALAAAEAIKTPGAFKQFIGSLFSLQTALSLGVTLLTIYGAELVKYISELIKGGEATDLAAKRFENLNKAFENPSISEAVKNVAELKINLGLAKDGLLDKEKVLNQYNETIGQTTGEVKSLDEAEKALGKNAKAYVQMTLFKAAAQLTLDEAAKASVEAAREALENEKNLSKQKNSAVIAGDKEGEALRKILVKDRKRLNDEEIKESEGKNKELIGIAEGFQAEAAKIAKDNKFDFFPDQKKDKDKKANTDAVDLLIQRVQNEADAQKDIANDQKESLDERLKAVQNFKDASIRLIDLTAKKELSEADLTKSKIIAIKENQVNEQSKVAKEAADLTYIINESAEKELSKLLKAGLKDYEDTERKKIELLQVSRKEQQELNSQFADDALLGLAEQYSKGIIDEQEYAKAKLDVQRQYVLDSIGEEIKGVQAIIDAKKAAGLDTADDEKAISELRKKLSKETATQEISDFELIGKAAKKLKETKEQLATEVGELATSIVNGTFENQKNKIQEEIDLADEKAKHDIDNVNLSVLSEEDKANRIAVIEATTAANKEVLEQKQRQVAQRQARFQKAASIASIISSTAQAIMKTYAEFGFPIGVPLAIAQGAIGAVQVATVLATPIPQYKYGKKKGDNYSGPAIVGDGYERELRIEKNGEMSLTPNTPTLTTVSAGTQIIGGADLRRLMSKPPTLEAARYDNGYDLSALIAAQENNNKKLIKAFSKQRPSKGPNINFYGLGDYMTRNFN